MGAGNKTLEMTIAEQLMQTRDAYDPEAQREILREFTLAITDDPDRAKRWVPDGPHISDSIHDAQLRFGTLMQGVPVDIKSGVNHTEIVEQLLKAMAGVVTRIQQTGGMATKEELIGLQSVGQHIAQEIGVVAKDETQKKKVKQYGDALGKIMNALKAFAQRLQEQMQKQNGQQQLDPKDIAKIKAIQLQAQAKVKNMRDSHADRTAQKQIAFQQQLKQKQATHTLDIQTEIAKHRIRSTEE